MSKNAKLIKQPSQKNSYNKIHWSQNNNNKNKQLNMKEIRRIPTEDSTHSYVFQPQTQGIYMNKTHNTMAVTLWISDEVFYIQGNCRQFVGFVVLKIFRKTGHICEIDAINFKRDKQKQQKLIRSKKLQNGQIYKQMQKMYLSFFVGIVDLNKISRNNPQKQNKSKDQQQKQIRKILVFAQHVEITCTINNRNILKIIKPIYIFYNSKVKSNLTDEQAVILINLGFVFEQGMYYSFSYDLTRPFYYIEQSHTNANDIGSRTTSQSVIKQEKNQLTKLKTFSSLTEQKQQLIQENVNEQFNWAYNLQKQLLHFHHKWRIPVIQGFVSKIQNYVNGLKIRIVIISRRSRKNGGPLQYSTGFYNKNFHNRTNTANYVQTQMIIHIKNLYFSFIQIRGTVPLYWKLDYSYGIPSAITFPEKIQTNYHKFNNHIKMIKDSHNFSFVLLLNLMDKEYHIERKLIQNFQYIVKKCQKQHHLFYTFFDLQHRCPNRNYKQLNKFIDDQLGNILFQCGFSVLEHRPGNKLCLLDKQKGVIRTNCGNCIQKTNNAQSRIAAWQIVNILKHINIKITNFDERLQFISDKTPFAKLYRTMWADNEDAISSQYSGTYSKQSATIRANKISYLSSIDNGLTSIMRAIRNIREEDFGKSKAIYLLLQQQQENCL